MATRVTHVIDENAPEEAVRLLRFVLRLAPTQHLTQAVLALGRVPEGLAGLDGIRVDRISRRCDWPVASVLELRQKVRAQEPEAIVAWGSAAAAVTMLRPRPTVVAVADPCEADEVGRWWVRATERGDRYHILCSSGCIQHRLMDAGVAFVATSVVPPGVDADEIKSDAASAHRTDLGLQPDARVLLTASPPSRDGGQFHAVWAAAILHQIWPDVRLVIPGVSREQRRLRRLIGQINCPDVFVVTENRYPPGALLDVSDMLVVPAIGDISIGWLAEAMAAGVPIVGSTVPSVAEVLTDGQNGFLCAPGEPDTLAACIRTAAEAGERRDRCIQAARQQAAEMFDPERCVAGYLAAIDQASGDL